MRSLLLLLMLVGPAQAARQITSPQIQDGTILPVDLDSTTTDTWEFINVNISGGNVASDIAALSVSTASLQNQVDNIGISYIKDDLSGTVDGVETNFTLSTIPPPNGLVLILDGLTQLEGVDYTLAGVNVSMTTAPTTETQSFMAYYSTGTTGVVGALQFVTADAPILGLGTSSDHLRLDSSSVTLLGPDIGASEVSFNYAGSASQAGPATTALALDANGSNCSAGNAPLGVDASGAAEGCFDVQTDSEQTTHVSNASAHHTKTTDASELTTGTLPNARLDSSSVTLLGPSPAHSSLSGIGANDHHVPTVDTNADTICTGTDVYLDGEGNCDTLTPAHGNGANCAAGNAPLGVDANGAVEGCFDVVTQAEASATTLAAFKTANESVANSDVIQDDDHLFLSLAANATYVMFLSLSAESSSNIPDMDWTLSVPAGTAINCRYVGGEGAGSHLNGTIDTPGVEENIDLNGGVIGILNLNCLVETSSTAGDIRFRWAQSTSNAAATTVDRASFIQARRIQ